jgi:hypothetical protein
MSEIRKFGPPPADHAAQADAIFEAVKSQFAGKHPAVIGWALVDLLAMHLAGYQVSPEAREKLLQDHIAAVRELLPLYVADNEQQLRAGRPPQ